MRYDHFTVDAMGYNNAPRPDAPPETAPSNERRMASRSSTACLGKISSVVAGSLGRFSGKLSSMSRILIANGYVVTVDSKRSVHPGGFVIVDGANTRRWELPRQCRRPRVSIR